MLKLEDAVALTKIKSLPSTTPARFHERFGAAGEILNTDLPRITTEGSELVFQPRNEGLRLLMINPPIREWSYPNIMPIGQGYVGAVARMDGHHLDVLDLNALRKEPVKENGDQFSKWVERQVTERLQTTRPDVIGIGGIITQYGRIKQITETCKRIYPEVPIILGGGISSCLPEFMIERLPIDVAVQEEGEVTFSELLHRLETGESLAGLKGVVYRHWVRPGEWTVRNNGLRPSIQARSQGLDALPWPLRSAWPEEELYKRNPVGHLNWKTKWIDGAAPRDSMQYSMSMIASRGCPYATRACDYCYA